jgi:hypothetical protein
MTKKINLKEMEKEAFRDSNQDGFMEIVFGVIFFSIAGYINTKDIPILLILLPIFGPIWMQIIRNKFTYPRIGYARPSKKMARQIICVLFIYIFIVLFMVFIFPFISNNWDLSLWNKWSPVFYGLITTGTFLYLGYRVGIIRYYIFATLSVIGLLSAFFIEFETLERGLEMYFLSMSGVMLIAGFVLFFIFLQRHELSKKEITDDK